MCFFVSVAARQHVPDCVYVFQHSVSVFVFDCVVVVVLMQVLVCVAVCQHVFACLIVCIFFIMCPYAFEIV
jgi:hypothetical protein